MSTVSKMTKEELLQYVQQLQQAQAQAQARAQAAEARAQAAEAAAAKKRAPATPKTHGELLASDPAYLGGAIWAHVQHLNLSASEEGALNALVTHALKGGKLMSAGASRQNLSRARRAVTGYLTEKQRQEAEGVVFDCLYCVPRLTVSPEGDYKGYEGVLAKSPRLLAQSLEAAESIEAAEEKRAQLDAAEKDFDVWLARQKAAIAEGKDKAEDA